MAERPRLTVSLWIALLALISGCGNARFTSLSGTSQDAEPTGGINYGGQTGSLIPDCGLSHLQLEGQQVPEGDTALVFYRAACSTEATVSLFDEQGMPVPVSLDVTENDGVVIVRTTETLPEGDYLAVLPAQDGGAQTQVIHVSAASPLPTELGELNNLTGSRNCGAPIYQLTLTDEALAYAALLQLEVSVNDAEPVIWVPYGELNLENRVANLPSVPCGDSCLEAGEITLTIVGKIAGEESTPAPLSTTFTAACEMQEPANDSSGNAACSVDPRKDAAPIQLALASLPLLIALRRRRRARRNFILFNIL